MKVVFTAVLILVLLNLFLANLVFANPKIKEIESKEVTLPIVGQKNLDIKAYLNINEVSIDSQYLNSFKLNNYGEFNEYTMKKKIELGALKYDIIDVSKLPSVESMIVCGKIKTFSNFKQNGSDYGTGFSRIILIGEDTQKEIHEYVIVDTSLFYNNAYKRYENIYEFCMIGEETLSLPSKITPLKIIIEGESAQVYLDKIYYSVSRTGLIYDIILELQNDVKINMLNDRNRELGFNWTAGNTGVSHYPYEIKKTLLGNTTSDKYDSIKTYRAMPNTYGIFFYSEGIFSFAPMETPMALPSDYDKISFSWRDAHSQDWTTSVKSQVGATCWAYAATAAHELMVNTYFARHLNKDLSEQQFISRNGTSNPVCGGQVNPAEQVAYTHGQFDEACFPATGSSTTPCSPCADWNTRAWKSTSYENSINYRNPVDLMKDLRSNGGMVLGLNEWNHAVNLVGIEMWRDDSALIMEYKNSWGSSWGIGGYGYLYGPIDIAVFNKWGHPETAATGAPTTQLCTDADSDGYCWWGLGSKPSTGCPSSCAGNDIPDCDDSDANKQGLIDGYICADTSDVISLCTTINSPGTYYLSGNLAASGNCININSDNVALMCSGATITGTGTGTGIKIDAQSDVRIYDCKLNNFNIGVEVLNSDGIMLADISVSNSNTGFKISGSENVVEKYGILTSNWKGVELVNSNMNYIYQNTFQSNTYGIYLTNSLNNEFQGNVIKTSSNTGFYADSASDSNEIGNLYSCSSSVKDINDQGTNEYYITACGSATGTACDYTCSVGCTNLFWPATYPGGDAYYPERIRETSEEGKHYFIIDAYGGTINLCEDGYYPLDYPTQQILLGTYNVVVDFKNSEFVGKTRDYGDYIFDPGIYPPFGNYPLIREDYEAWFSKGTIKNMKISNVSTGIALMGTSGSTITTWDNIHFENVKVGAYARNLKIINSKFINCDEHGIFLYDVEGNQLDVQNSEFKNIGTYAIHTNAVSSSLTTPIRVENNYFENANKLFFRRGDSSKTDEIKHNILYNTGMEVELENVNIINNTIMNSPYDGLFISSYAAGTVSIQDNAICGSAGGRDIRDSSSRGTYSNNACGSSTPSGVCVGTSTYYRDADGDGYGDPLVTITSACPSSGYVGIAGDCNDGDPLIYPGAEEICDNKDNNCDGTTDNIIDDCGSGVCTGTKLCTAGIWSDCSTDGNSAGICAKCNSAGNPVYDSTNNGVCDDGMFCNGEEVCIGIYTCGSGAPINCEANNLAGIETCNNNPDANPFTWDFFAGFTSTCNEETESCTLGTVDLTHECSVTDCDAECDAENDCEDTDCEDLSGCYAGKYRTYSNVPNTCLDDCVCTENECSMDFEYTLTGTDADGDGWDLECGDCDDSNPNVHPDAEEICNGIDDNCNGEIDEDLPIYTYYRDSDGDGYGDPTNTFETCTDYPAEGYVEDNTDCNDLNYFVNPEMEEICNGIDDNCDMIVDEITEECGEGICAGEKLCIVGHWSDCSSDGQDAGICALCDADGYVIYDETQNTDCNEGVECAIGNCYAIFECTYEPDHSYCDNGIYCDGTEYCNLDFGCQEGVPVDCSGNNLAGIATCTNDPDANPFTWDFFGGFTSTCNEDVRACTIGTIELTHECSVESCDAECDAENDCEDTDCSALSGCVGLDYYEYSNVPNTCLDDCLCTDNECSIYEIYENDYRCTNCHECEHLQLYIPNGIEREEYHFGGYTIIVDEITEEKIYFHYSYLGEYLYRGSVSIGKQIVDTPHNPVAPSLLTKVCDVREVETENEWGCFGFNLIGETTCESDSDCSSLNTIYCTGDLIMQTEGICEENICVAETIELENCNTYNTESCDGTNRIYSDYSCSAGECIAYDSTIIEECDNEIYCDGQETCTELLDGITECQAGTPVDCSGNNLLSIETCNNNPDANPFTWDFFGGFTSTCNEETESCTLGTVDLTHECSVTDCDAECDAENDCEDTDCSALSGCVGLDYYEYSNVPNDCLGDCTCTDNECSVYEVFGDDLRCELRECVEPYAGMIIMEDTIFCEGEYEVFGNITIGADNIVIEGNNTVIIGNIWYEEDTRNSEEQQETYSIKKTEYRDEGNYLNGITIKNIKFINYGIGTSFFNNSKIQNNTFEGFSSIYGTYTLNSEIIDNTIRTEGIYFLIAPLDFMNSDNLTIERNIIENDEETLLSMGSLLLLNTHNSKITDNTIVCEETMGDGIYILGNNNEIISNSVTTCYRGLFSNGAYYNIIEDNYLCRNEIDILLDTSTGNNIGDNICDEVIDLSIYPSNSVTCSIDCVLNLLTGECIDSDEGYNIFNYGETTYLGESKKDNCRDELSLYEYFCDINGVMRSSIEYCPFGYVCLDGECKSLLTIDKYIQTKDGIEKIYEGYNKPDTNSIKPPTTSVNKESSSKDFKP